MYLPSFRPVVWFGLACVAAGASQALGRREAPGAMALALGLLGAGLCAMHLGPWPAGSLARELPWHDEPQILIEVEGLIIERPEAFDAQPGALTPFVPKHMERGRRTRFDLDSRRVRAGDEWRDASGVLTVWVDHDEGPPDVRAGQSVRITGSAGQFEPPGNPGGLDYTLHGRDTNNVGSLTTSVDLITEIEPHSPIDRFAGAAIGWRAALQSRAASIIEDATRDDPYAGPIVRGLLMGSAGQDDLGVKGAFRRVGMLHLLAVSGFHVAVAAALALLAIRLTGDRGWIEPMVVCLALGLYVLIVPMRAPIFRAAILVLVILAGDALGRRHDRISVVCWIGIVWLAFRPSDLFELGFQLSFGLTGWLMLLSEPRRDDVPALNEATRAEIVRAFVWRPVKAALACWSLATPAIIFHTGVFSPLAVMATLVTVPMIIATMWLGFVVLVLGTLVPALAPMASELLRFFAGGAARFALAVDHAPLATLHVTGASLAWTVCAIAGVIWIWRHARLRDWRWGAVLAALGLWLGVEVAYERHGNREAAAVRMLDVGNASAILVQSGGEAALWDCGSWSQDVGRKLIPDACRALGEPRIDTVFITHANIDHYMGVLDVIEPLGVRRVVTGESFARAAERDPGGAPAFVLAELARLGVEHRIAVAGDVFEVGDSQLRILHPPAGFLPRAENDASLVAMLEPPGEAPRAMLTGDIQQEAMALLMESGEDLHAGAIELPHHGSAHEAAYAFVEHVDPGVVLQSTGFMRLDDPRWDGVRSARTWLVTTRHGMSSVLLMPDGSIRAEAYR